MVTFKLKKQLSDNPRCPEGGIGSLNLSGVKSVPWLHIYVVNPELTVNQSITWIALKSNYYQLRRCSCLKLRFNTMPYGSAYSLIGSCVRLVRVRVSN